MQQQSQSCVLCRNAIGTDECSADIFSRLDCDPETIIVNKLSSVLECRAESISGIGSRVCSSCLQRVSALHQLELRVHREKRAISQLFHHCDDLTTRHSAGNSVVLDSGVRVEWPVIDQSEAATSQSADDVTRVSSWKRRRRAVNTSRRYQCMVCEKRFVAYSHRVEHMLTHLGETPWPCSVCQRQFRTKSALTAHTRRIHEKNSQPPALTPSLTDDSTAVCNGNVLDHHESSTTTLTTPSPASCSSGSSRSASLSHPELMCDQCGRQFRRRHHLTLHARQHSGERPFTCGVCAARFVNRSRLNRHTLVHSEKRHVCTVCQRRFRRGYDLRRHLLECGTKLQQQTVAPSAVPSLTLVPSVEAGRPAATILLSGRQPQPVYYQLAAGALCVAASDTAVIAADSSSVTDSVPLGGEGVPDQFLASQYGSQRDLQPVLVSVASAADLPSASSTSSSCPENDGSSTQPSAELLTVPCMVPALSLPEATLNTLPY